MNSKIRDIAYMMLEYAIRFLLVFLVNIYIATSLGSEKYGEISFYALIIVLISGVMKLNSDSEIFREIINNEDERKIHETQIYKKTLVSILISPVVLVLLYSFDIPLYWSVIILFFLYLNIFEYLEMLKIAKKEIKELMLRKVKLIIFFSIIKILLLQFSENQNFFIFISFFEILILIIMLMNENKSKLKLNYSNIKNKERKQINFNGWQLPLIFMFYLNIDQMYVYYFYDIDIYGEYAFVVKFILLFNFLPGMVLNNFSDHLYIKIKRNKILILIISLAITCALLLKIFMMDYIYLFNKDYHEQIDNIEYYFFTMLGVFFFSYSLRLSTLLNQVGLFINVNYIFVLFTIICLYGHNYFKMNIEFIPVIIGVNLILSNIMYRFISKFLNCKEII